MSDTFLERKITDEEYIHEYDPVGPWLLIQKDVLPEKVGAIFIPNKIKEDNVKFTGTGVIVKKGTPAFESEYQKDIADSLEVGDRVGFGISVPMISPSPPNYRFKEEANTKFVTLHVTDVLCILKGAANG